MDHRTFLSMHGFRGMVVLRLSLFYRLAFLARVFARPLIINETEYALGTSY